MVDYQRTGLVATLATAATSTGALLLTLLARAAAPGHVTVTLAALTGTVAALALHDAWRTRRGHVRRTLATSRVNALLGAALVLAPHLMDPAGAAARPLLATLLMGAGLLVAAWSSYTCWCAVAAPVPVPWLHPAHPRRGATQARAPRRAPR